MKSVKSIAEEFNKKLTRRQASRQAQNLRRKLQRRLASELSEQTGSKVSWKEAVSFYEGSKVESSITSEIYSDIKSLQAKQVEGKKQRIGYGVEIEEVRERTEERFPSSQTQVRRNRMFTHELNEATKVRRMESGEYEKAGLSSLSKNEVHAFYTATYEMWKGTSIEQNRNKDIMKAFGIKDLKTIYKLLTEDELKAKDFGFDDEEKFDKWLKEIKQKVDVDELRKILKEELQGESDVPETKYKKNAMKNIKIRVANVRFKK